MAEWKKVRIGDFLKRSRIPIDIKNDQEYKRVTIRTKHQGVSLRDKVIGKRIGTKKQFVLKAGQFILSKIDARYGAFGIVPEEVDGAIITGNFWAYNIDNALTSVDWINNYTNSIAFYDLCERASSGITHRRYLNEDAFLNHELYLPLIAEQASIIKRFEEQKNQISNLRSFVAKDEDSIVKFRQAVLQEAIEGKFTAEWRKQNPEFIRGENHASKLLEKMRAKKDRLIKESEIRADKPVPTIADDEKPFILPEGWAWCRLGDLFRISSGDGLIAKDMAKGGKYPVFGGNGINGYHDKFNISKPTIVIGRVGALCGSIHVTPKKAWVTDNAFITYYAEHLLCGSWLERLLVALNLRDRARETAQPVISGKRVYPITVALPPYAEQKAIVQVVNNLIVMIDELEKQITEREEQSELLMQSVLREAFEHSHT